LIRAALATLCALSLLAAGCGGDDSSSSSENTTKEKKPEQAVKAKEPTTPRGTTLKVVSSQFGPIAADRRGQAFYLFAKEKSKTSQCYGACAEAWPPVLTKGRPRAGKGGRGALLGTTRRRDGKVQLTYAGHPMYYFSTDSPGQIKCHNVSEFGGLWLVVKPNGKPVS
jgi:predicted lipoprotein with Yx(FWY)xxD motif